MLKALMKVRLLSLKEMYFAGAKNKKAVGTKGVSKGRVVLIAGLVIYVFVVFAAMFFSLFSMLAAPFYSAGISWLYFALYALVSFAVMFFGSVFTAKAQLFEAKDNDLLLSLPIKTSHVLFSRIATLWLINAFLGLMISLPVAAAWCLNCPVNALGVISYIVLTLMLTVFSVAVAAFFGWLVSLLTRRVRNKSLITTVFSFAFFAAYFVVINRASTVVMELAANGGAVAQKLQGVFILVWAGKAMAGESVLMLLLSSVCLAVPFIIAYIVLNATFIKTVTTKHTTQKKKYTKKALKQKTPFGALVGREASRFFASSVYIMNAGMGVIFQVAAGVALLFYMPTLLPSLAAYGLPSKYICPALAVIISLMNSMTDISAASVSMEGKNIWISKMLPVKTESILLSKIMFHMAAAGPASLIASVCVAIAAKATFAEAAVIIILPFLFAVFTAVLGLAANLRFPNLNWDNEAQAVKTGAAIFVAMFGSMGALVVISAIGIGFSFIMDINLAALIACAVAAAVTAVMYKWIMTGGVKRYEDM